MTTYAYRVDTDEVLATWDTGAGACASLVTTVSDQESGMRLVALTSLSEASWDIYTRPPTSEGDPEEANTAAWRQQHARAALDRLTQVVSNPNLPGDAGLLVSYIPTEEAGHRVGRVLHAIGDPQVRRDVLTEIEAEVDAVRRADFGDLTGRAQQAAALSRLELSPTQAQAAWDVLRERALDLGEGLVGSFDPTAAATAAAAWLWGAAEIAVEGTRMHWTRAVERADDIEALPHATPTAVLEALDAGLSPSEVVLQLVSDALTVAEGQIPADFEELTEGIAEAVERAGQLRGVTPRDRMPRLTPLNPQRPAPDLLEDLLWGIWGCFLLWQEEHWDLLDGDEDIDTELAGDDDEGDDDGGTAVLAGIFLERLANRMERVDRDTL